jgi:hypothetical protein
MCNFNVGDRVWVTSEAVVEFHHALALPATVVASPSGGTLVVSYVSNRTPERSGWTTSLVFATEAAAKDMGKTILMTVTGGSEAKLRWHREAIRAADLERKNRVPVYPDSALVARAMRNARPNQVGGVAARWVAVRDTFGVGSTVARVLCQQHGLDPDEEVAAFVCDLCCIEGEDHG